MKNKTFKKDLNKIPDYLGDGFSARMLATKLQSSYHKKGFPKVRVWVEEERDSIANRSTFSIRSNIKFNVNSIYEGNVR